MAELRTQKSKPKRGEAVEPPSSFDITCVVGTVELSRNGEGDPVLAAFEQIAAYLSSGGDYVDRTLRFEVPGYDHSAFKVSVTTEYVPGVEEAQRRAAEEKDKEELPRVRTDWS